MSNDREREDFEDQDEGPEYVRCPECGNEQADMGANVDCEECDFGPMPYYKRRPAYRAMKAVFAVIILVVAIVVAGCENTAMLGISSPCDIHQLNDCDRGNP